MIETAEFTLPGGMLAPSGERHRDGCLRPLTGADEEWIHSLAPSTRHAAVVTELLARCVVRIGPCATTTESMRDLNVGDRDFLLIKLREATFGPRISRVLACPHDGCGARMDLDLLVGDFAIDERPTQPSHRLRLDGAAEREALAVEFRVPRGRDLELISAQAATSVDELRDRLLRWCVVQIAAVDDGEPSSFAALSAASKEALAAAIEDAAPRVELELELVCPDCARTFDVVFDPASLLLEDVGAARAAFERELHLLALHYHWSPRELLALTRPRRLRYLRVLAEELAASRGRA
jgi:hypothetical protein